MRPSGPTPEPAVASADAARWRHWLAMLIEHGRRRLGQAGLALLLGLLIGAGALYLFLDLADEVSEGDTVRLDTAVLGWLQARATPALDTIMATISTLGSEMLWLFLPIALVVLGRQGRWGAVASLVVTTGGALLLNSFLKELYGRPRPTPVGGLIPSQAFSFPSGHATVSTAFYLYLAYLGWQLLRGVARLVWVAACIAVILLVCLSRLYLGVHFFTDVVGGILAGFIWVSAVILAGHLLARRRARAAPAPPAEATLPPAG